MRLICWGVLFVGCVTTRGIAIISDANPALQKNSETAASSSSSRPSAAQGASAHESKDQKEASVSSDARGRSHHLSPKLQPPTSARSEPATHPKPVPNDRKRSRTENLNSVHLSTPTQPSSHAANSANTRGLLIRPVTGSAIDGRQFGMGRNTAAAPAIGASTNARKNAQGLNGTEAARRH